MKKIVLTYGLIAGTILGSLLLATMPLWNAGILNFDNGEVVGYTTMVIALSLIFFGIKSYRDNYAGGTITFWKATKIGLLITLLAAIMYSLAWEVSFRTMSKDFIQKMTNHYVEALEKEDLPPEELSKKRAEIISFTDMYTKYTVIRFGMTLLEPLPVGIIITFLSAGLLRKKEFLAAENVQIN